LPTVKHMVLLKFKPTTSEGQIAEAFRALRGLQEKIPGLKDFMGGPYSSPEGLNQGFTHGFIMTFDSASARDVYLPHPEHERVKAQLSPHLDGVVAFDFEVP
jgi:hypothetical protein